LTQFRFTYLFLFSLGTATPTTMFSRPERSRNTGRPLDVRLRIAETHRRPLDRILTKDVLQKAYIVDGKSILQIADDLGVDYRTVWWRIHDYGIPTRSHHWRIAREGPRFKKGNVPWNKGKQHLAGERNPMKHLSAEQRAKFKQMRSKVEGRLWIKPSYRALMLKRVFPSKDTSIERKMQAELSKRGIRFAKHLPILNCCQADIAFPERKLAVFCDGDYWHNRPDRRSKDIAQEMILRANGWHVLRFWEHEINASPAVCADRVVNELSISWLANVRTLLSPMIVDAVSRKSPSTIHAAEVSALRFRGD